MAQLDPKASLFFDDLYGAAKAGCVSELRASGCSEEEAEEFFGEALLKVIDEVDPIAREFDPPQMVNFLKRASRNCLLDDRRHRGVLKTIDLDKADSIGAARGKGLEEIAADHETLEAVQGALRSLSAREREVFCRRYLGGMSPEEIQRQSELTSRSYRKLVERANAKVRANLESGERA